LFHKVKQNRLYFFPTDPADFHTKLRQLFHFKCELKAEGSAGRRPVCCFLQPSAY